MFGIIKAKVNFMLVVLNVNPQLGSQENTIMKTNDSTVDTFYGFWKYLGLTGTFLIGVVLFWSGCLILINDWANVRESLGWIGNIILAPLIAGTALSWVSFVEFLRIIRNS